MVALVVRVGVLERGHLELVAQVVAVGHIYLFGIQVGVGYAIVIGICRVYYMV